MTAVTEVCGRLGAAVPFMSERRRSILRWAARGLTSCLDQGAVSGVNFAINVLLARWLAPAEYGAFAVAFALFLFVAGFHNALLVDPACVLGPARFRDHLPSYFRRIVCVHGAWCLLASAAVVVAALAIRDASLHKAFWGLVVALPFLLLLWLLRRLCYVGGSPMAALFSSAAYGPLVLGGLFLLRRWIAPTPFAAFLVIAAASLGASAAVWNKLRLAGPWAGIRTSEFLDLARSHWNYGKWLCAASLLTFGVTQLQTFLIAGYLGLEAAGAFRAMFNLIQPMNQLTAAVALLFVPNLSADFGAGETARLRTKGMWITATLAGLSICYELVLLIFGSRISRLFYGPRFARYDWLIPVLGLMPVLIAVASGFSLVLQAIQRPQHYLIRGAVTGPVGIGSAVVLTSWLGLGGAAASMVLTLAISVVVTLTLYRRYGPVERAAQT